MEGVPQTSAIYSHWKTSPPQLILKQACRIILRVCISLVCLQNAHWNWGVKRM
ncbi:unnamed protein product, partial [Nesidiocoris tenuis]